MLYVAPPEGYDFTKNSSFQRLYKQSNIDMNILLEIVNKTYNLMDYIYNDSEILSNLGNINSLNPTFHQNIFDTKDEIIDLISEKGNKYYFMIKSIDEVNEKFTITYLTIPFELKIPGITEHCADRIRNSKINSIINE